MSETSQTSSENEKSKTNRPPRKRQVHNEVERRRKYKINNWISKISELLPNKELHKKSKICILEQTVDYIKELVVERDKLLSEQCSDVQLEEVRKLKKELNLIQEQNRVYAKLLQQANISLSSLPKKATKYSNKFTEQNGLQLLQQSEQADQRNTSSPPQEQRAMQVCSSSQDSLCTSVALISASACSQILQTSSSSTSSTAVLSSSVRDHNSRTTAEKTLSCVSAQNISTVPVLPTCTIYTSTPVPSASAFINSQGTIPSYTSGSVFSAKTTVSVGSGGVTPALSPFPLMSTTLSSSVSDIYSKSVRMILMPSSTPIPTERVTLSNLNISSSLVHTLPISVPKTVANHCIISPLNYGNTLNVLPESALISNGVQISTDPLPNNALCINLANGFLNSGFIIAAPVVSSSGNSSPCVKITSQTNVHSNINEVVSTLPVACENLQSVVPPAVPLTRENCILSSSTASQIGVTSVSQNDVCVKVMQPTASSVQSDASSKSHVLATESLSALSTTTSSSISSNSSAMHNLPDVHMEIVSSEPCSNVISDNQLAQSENSLNFVPLSSENSEHQVHETNTEAVPLTSPLSLKVLCTRKIVLFSRQHQNAVSDLSQPSFPNISSSVVQDEVIQFQPHESVSSATSGLSSLSEDISKSSKTLPHPTNSHIRSVPAMVNVSNNISPKSSTDHELFSPSQHKNKVAEPSPDVGSNLSMSNIGNKDHSIPICSSVINDSSNTIFVLNSSNASAGKLAEPQNTVTGDKRSLDSSTMSHNTEMTHQDSGRNKISSLHEGVSHSIISDVSSTLSAQSNTNSVSSSLPKPAAVELGFKPADIVTPDSTSYSVATSKCSSQIVSSASISPMHINGHSTTKTLTESDRVSKSSSSTDSVKPIPCNAGVKSSQPDNNGLTLCSSVGQGDKNSVQISESNLSALPSLFHNSQLFNPPCINIQPSSSNISIPLAPTLSSSTKPNPEKSAVISSSNLSLSTIGFNALLPTHNVIPLMATPSVSSLTAPSYCIGANDKSCNLLTDKTGTLSFPIILSGYSDCDVIENKSVFPNVDANFSINFLNANFSSTVQKSQPPACSSKKRSKLATKKAKYAADNKNKGGSSSDNALPADYSSKYQTLASSEVHSSDVENIELHKASLDQPSLFLSNDILAKATESIFCNSILDGGQGPPECQEELMNSEQSPPVDLNNSSTSEGVTTDSSKIDSGNESSKKSPPVDISSTENACSHNSKANEIISSENREKESSNDSKEKTVSRIRKSSNLEGEPLSKRAKGELNKIKDPTPTQNAQSIRQTEFYVNKLVAQEANAVKGREETFNTVENASRDNALLTVNAKDTESLQTTCNNSKSLSPGENAFPSGTPSLGEILKDVSHGMMNFNPRSNVSSQSEGHGLLPAEKIVVTSENSMRNAGDEFLQLPQSYFPTTCNVTVPQLSSASLCQSGESCKTVTNSVSRQGNQKKGSDSAQWAQKNDNGGVLSYSNVLKEKDSKHSCVTQSSLQPSTDSSGTTTFLYPEASNIIPSIPTSDIIPMSPSTSVSNQFGVQSVCASVTTPVIPPNINFNRGSQVQQNFLHASPPPLLSRNYSCQSNSQTVPFSSHNSENMNSAQALSSQSPAASSDSLSHSLCSLLKDTSSQLANIPSKNAANKNTLQTSTTTYSSTSSTSVSHSKYSALSLISHQTFSGSSSGISTSLSTLQPSVMTASSCQQMNNTPVTTHSVCNRNTRTSSLSYSAENLIHSQVMEVDKDKSKTIISGSYFPHKKGEQDLVQSIHDVGDSNIFMPLGGSDINTQSMSMVPLPPVTSFPSFPSNYSMCDAAPPVSLRCSGTMDRAPDLPLQLQPNEGSFLRHTSINDPSAPSHSDRHVAHSSNMTSMTKPHSNLSLSFESHGSFYNNCNFLQHPKPNLDSSAVPDNNPCFQATAFNSGYAQSIQKQNCCHFSHQAVASHSGLIADTSLPIITSVGPFHAEKNDSLMNRPSLENNSSQSCSNYIGNIFYDSSCNRQVVGTKPSSMNLSQELYSPLGVRQNTHHNPPSSGNAQNQRKNLSSGKTKSKKVKQASVSENSVNTNAAASNNSSNVNFFSVPEISCSKSNIPPVPNCYFKNSHQTPASLQPTNDKNKLSENILNPSLPPNPPFNPILHPQNDGLLNLNFQPPNFGMSSLSRPPPPLCCSCITSPVITQTFTTAATHPVPNFNLSNILPDMGCSSSESVTLSPIKFHPPSHMLPAPPPPSVPSQCQGDSSQVGSGHSLSRQGSGPSLYPPHPPVIHNTFSPLLNHASHGLNRNHAPMSGSGTSCTAPQAATFVPTQPPPFRNVIQSLNFTRSDR